MIGVARKRVKIIDERHVVPDSFSLIPPLYFESNLSDNSVITPFTASMTYDDGETELVDANWSVEFENGDSPSFISLSADPQNSLYQILNVGASNSLLSINGTITASYSLDGQEYTDSIPFSYADDLAQGKINITNATLLGPSELTEGIDAEAQYQLQLTLTEDITITAPANTVIWSLDSPFAEVSSNGLLTISSVYQDETIRLTGRFSYGEDYYELSKDVLLRNQDSAELLVNITDLNGQEDVRKHLSQTVDGNFTVFETLASLTPLDTNTYSDIYYFDKSTGENVLVSRGSGGAASNGHSRKPNLSYEDTEARFIVFESDASNLVSADDNQATDIFLFDKTTQFITRVSVNSDGVQGNADSNSADVSYDPTLDYSQADGQGIHVTFSSIATNLVNNDHNEHRDIFIRNVDPNQDGIVTNDGVTSRVSWRKSTGHEANNNSDHPQFIGSIWDRKVLFESDASDLVLADENGVTDLFSADILSPDLTITPVSVTADGFNLLEGGGRNAKGSSWNGDEEVVVFESIDVGRAAIEENVAPTQVYMRLLRGARGYDQTRNISLASRDQIASQQSDSEPVISADKRFILFRRIKSSETGGYNVERLLYDLYENSVARQRFVDSSNTALPIQRAVFSECCGEAQTSILFSSTDKVYQYQMGAFSDVAQLTLGAVDNTATEHTFPLIFPAAADGLVGGGVDITYDADQFVFDTVLSDSVDSRLLYSLSEEDVYDENGTRLRTVSIADASASGARLSVKFLNNNAVSTAPFLFSENDSPYGGFYSSIASNQKTAAYQNYHYIPQIDSDGDGIYDYMDPFPESAEFADMDRDGIGDNVDADKDGDHISNELEVAIGLNDSYWEYYADGNGDGVIDIIEDFDGDGDVDFIDPDDDNDGVPDANDACPNTPLGQSVDSYGCNNAPEILGQPAGLVDEGGAYQFTPTAYDPEGGALLYSIENKPDWASFHILTGELSGTPDYTQAGVYADITISVSDGDLSSSLETFTIEVVNVEQLPEITDQPEDVALSSGSVARFEVAVQSLSGDFTCQWFRDGEVIVSETEPSLELTVTEADDGAVFSVEVSNVDGTVESSFASLRILPDRVENGLELLYQFGSEYQLYQGTDVLAMESQDRLDLTLSGDARLTSEGLVLNETGTDGIAYTQTAPAVFINAIKASNEVTFEVWMKPGDVDQASLARIVTLSQNDSVRNAVLAQSESSVLGSVRTSSTNLYGPYPYISGGQIGKSTEHHVVYTRAVDGVVRLYVDGYEMEAGIVGGDLSNWYDNYLLSLGNEAASERPWSGTIKLAAMYARALSTSEVEQNFLAGGGVYPPNRAPVAAAAAVSTTLEGENVILDGSNSHDEDGDALTYAWSSYDPNVVIENAASAIANFTAPDVSADTDYTFNLTVSDGEFSAQTDVVVTVSPVVEELVNGVDLAVTFVDHPLVVAPDSSFYHDIVVKNRGDIGVSGGNIYWIVYLSTDPLVDTNDLGLYGSWNWRNPTWYTGFLPGESIGRGDFIYMPHNLDYGLYYLGTYIQWSDVNLENNWLVTPILIGDSSSDFDGDGISDIDDAFPLVPLSPNQAPVAAATAVSTALEGENVILDGSNSYDEDGDALTYAWSSYDPNVAIENATSAIANFTAPDVSADTDYTFNLTVSDGEFSAQTDVVVTVSPVVEELVNGVDLAVTFVDHPLVVAPDSSFYHDIVVKNRGDIGVSGGNIYWIVYLSTDPLVDTNDLGLYGSWNWRNPTWYTGFLPGESIGRGDFIYMPHNLDYGLYYLGTYIQWSDVNLDNNWLVTPVLIGDSSTDFDGDGISDIDDAFPLEPLQ